MSGLKRLMVDRDPSFTEKAFGYRSFLEFCLAARNRGLIELEQKDSQHRLRLA